MEGFVLVLVVSKEQAVDDHSAIARVCHDFDANTVADLSVAIDHAAKSAQRQLRHAQTVFAGERAVRERRASIRQVAP